MPTLAAVFRILNEMKSEHVVADYALGGAMAAMFYAEPARTYDLDVFVLLSKSEGLFIDLSPIYAWLSARGHRPDAEHVLIHGVPVQFLPAYNKLVEAAVEGAESQDYEGVEVRVSPAEHLIALALQAGGAKRRERAHQLLASATLDRAALCRLLEAHDLPTGILDDV